MGSHWWAQAGQFSVVLLADVTVDEVVRALDPLPPDAPALVACPPVSVSTVAACVEEILDALEMAAVNRFPLWLPGAADLAGSRSAAAAVKAAAASLAAGTDEFGPFLADLAIRAVDGRAAKPSGISAQQRARGLTQVIARTVGRDQAVLVLEAPSGQAIHEEQVRAGTARWLAEQSGLKVWLAGGPLHHVDWIRSFRVDLGMPSRAPVVIEAPPVAPIELSVQGKPKRGAETKLADALAGSNWVGAHLWNTSLDLARVGPLMIPDIQWPREKVIVEIDGSEHRGSAIYGADRRRDAAMLLSGYLVVRFTNEQVEIDLPYVLQTIRDLLAMRRDTVAGKA